MEGSIATLINASESRGKFLNGMARSPHCTGSSEMALSPSVKLPPLGLSSLAR